MTIYPAIDLINGQAVRLEKGDYNALVAYSDNPAAVAKSFEKQGAKYIHIVDLDGAVAKKPVNLASVKSIRAAVDTRIQVGGGIRSLESAEKILKYADRVIIGTVAVAQPEVLKQMLDRFGPKKIVISVDYKNGSPAINGWLEEAKLSTAALQARMRGLGVLTVIVTDTAKDGLMSGPNVELMKKWTGAGFAVICAGGVTTVEDIAGLAEAGIDGAIIGKALYENKINLKEAIGAGK